MSTNILQYYTVGPTVFSLKLSIMATQTKTVGKKKVHFIRHAESICNALRRSLGVHVLPVVIPNPGLTYEGIQQGKRLKEYVNKNLKPEIALCSPYTRTLQTCLLSYGSENVIITPLCGECMESCDDIGLPASCLKGLYPMFDFSALDEIWWFTQDGVTSQKEAVSYVAEGKLEYESIDFLTQRMEKFYDFLLKRPEKSLAVYAHSEFLCKFLAKYFQCSKSHLENTEVYSVEML